MRHGGVQYWPHCQRRGRYGTENGATSLSVTGRSHSRKMDLHPDEYRWLFVVEVVMFEVSTPSGGVTLAGSVGGLALTLKT